jgi:hypothetical protein
MILRRKQMAMFRIRAENTVTDQAMRFLRSELPAGVAGMSDDVLRRRVERTRARALALGLATDMALQVFLAMTFALGPRFERHPAAVKILRDPARSADERATALLSELSDRIWEEMGILAGGDRWDGEPVLDRDP